MVVSGFYTDEDGSKYYCDENGYLYVGDPLEIDGVRYTFDSEGKVIGESLLSLNNSRDFRIFTASENICSVTTDEQYTKNKGLSFLVFLCLFYRSEISSGICAGCPFLPP